MVVEDAGLNTYSVVEEVEVASKGMVKGSVTLAVGAITSPFTWPHAEMRFAGSPVWISTIPVFCGEDVPAVATAAVPKGGMVMFCQEAVAVPTGTASAAPPLDSKVIDAT